MRILLPIIVALVPLAIAPQFFFYFDITPKVVVLCLGLAIALVTCTNSWPRQGAARVAAWLLVGQIGWLGFVSLLSRQPSLSLAGGTWRRLGFVEYAAVLTFALLVLSDSAGRRERVMGYLRAIAASGLPIALYGILQHFGLDPLQWSFGYQAGEGPFTIVRPPSTLGHASYLGTYLIYVTFAGVVLAQNETNRLWRMLGISTAFCASLGIVFSGTRAAMAGAALGALILFVRVPALRTRRIAFVAAALFAGFVALTLSPAGASIRSRIHWSIDEPLGGARPLLWRDSAAMAMHRLLTGYGPETFANEFPRHQSAGLARAYPEFEHESPHNAVLDAVVEQGIPGMLLFCFVTALALWQGFSSSPGPVAMVMAAGFAGALLAQQFNVFTLATALMFYVFAALIIALSSPAVEALAPQVWWRVASAVPALALLLFAGWLAIADHELAGARDAFARDDLNSALAHYQRERALHVPGTAADLYVSRELAALFQRTRDVRVKLRTWTPAFQAAVRATGTTPSRKSAFYNLAIFFATQNDAAGVERCLRNAIYLAPNWFKPHWTLSRLLLQEGRLKEARTEADRAVSLDGGKNSEVVETLSLVRSKLTAEQRPVSQ